MWILLLTLSLWPGSPDAPAALGRIQSPPPTASLRDRQDEEHPSPSLIKDTVQLLRNTLGSKQAGPKLDALQAAAKVADPAVVHAILAALKDRDSEVRAAALEALRWNTDPSAVLTLHRLLESDRKLQRDETLSALLIKAIGQHADPSSLEVLAKNPFSTPNTEASRARIRGLGRIRTRESVAALIGLLRGTSKKTLRRFQDDFHLSLVVLTGADLGTDAAAWIRWWNEGGKKAKVAPERGSLPRRIETRWHNYWGIAAPERNADRREERGRDPRSRGK